MEKYLLPNGRQIFSIQRLTDVGHLLSDRRARKAGLRASFGLDYMGSAEFEWERPSESMAKMRAAVKFRKIHELQFLYTGPDLKSDGGSDAVKSLQPFSFFYIGPESYIDAIRALFENQAINPSAYRRLRERTCIDQAYNLDPEARKHSLASNIIGWWDIDNNWTAFKTLAHAELWMKELQDDQADSD